jgi:hypothetical protein
LLATGWWITTRPSRLPSSAQHDQGRDQA